MVRLTLIKKPPISFREWDAEECLKRQPEVNQNNVEYSLMPGVLHNREEQCKAEFSDDHIPCYNPLSPPGDSPNEVYSAFKVLPLLCPQSTRFVLSWMLQIEIIGWILLWFLSPKISVTPSLHQTTCLPTISSYTYNEVQNGGCTSHHIHVRRHL